jgi:hypothetical protein
MLMRHEAPFFPDDAQFSSADWASRERFILR